MASIIKRKKNYSVVYNYVDENGETKQKWETWHTHKEALKRKAEIENQQHTGTFLPPSNQTITEFLYDFVSLYGEKKWGVSMYDSQTALIANYINPIIGDIHEKRRVHATACRTLRFRNGPGEHFVPGSMAYRLLCYRIETRIIPCSPIPHTSRHAFAPLFSQAWHRVP